MIFSVPLSQFINYASRVFGNVLHSVSTPDCCLVSVHPIPCHSDFDCCYFHLYSDIGQRPDVHLQLIINKLVLTFMIPSQILLNHSASVTQIGYAAIPYPYADNIYLKC